jgi:hypothetical protein
MRDKSYVERLKELKLPTLAYRRMRGDMIEVFKICHRINDKDVCNILKMRKDEVERINRGHSSTLFHQYAKRNLRKHSFTLRVVWTWNSLPEEVVNAPSLNTFKNWLDKLWQHQDIYYNYKITITCQKKKSMKKI